PAGDDLDGESGLGLRLPSPPSSGRPGRRGPARRPLDLAGLTAYLLVSLEAGGHLLPRGSGVLPNGRVLTRAPRVPTRAPRVSARVAWVPTRTPRVPSRTVRAPTRAPRVSARAARESARASRVPSRTVRALTRALRAPTRAARVPSRRARVPTRAPRAPPSPPVVPSPESGDALAHGSLAGYASTKRKPCGALASRIAREISRAKGGSPGIGTSASQWTKIRPATISTVSPASSA